MMYNLLLSCHTCTQYRIGWICSSMEWMYWHGMSDIYSCGRLFLLCTTVQTLAQCLDNWDSLGENEPYKCQQLYISTTFQYWEQPVGINIILQCPISVQVYFSTKGGTCFPLSLHLDRGLSFYINCHKIKSVLMPILLTGCHGDRHCVLFRIIISLLTTPNSWYGMWSFWFNRTVTVLRPSQLVCFVLTELIRKEHFERTFWSEVIYWLITEVNSKFCFLFRFFNCLWLYVLDVIDL